MSISKTNEAEAHLSNNFDLLNTKKTTPSTLWKFPCKQTNFLVNGTIGTAQLNFLQLQNHDMLLIAEEKGFKIRYMSGGGVSKLENAHVSIKEGVLKCSLMLTWGREGSKFAQIMLT